MRMPDAGMEDVRIFDVRCAIFDVLSLACLRVEGVIRKR
jgi:hypothetical protein